MANDGAATGDANLAWPGELGPAAASSKPCRLICNAPPQKQAISKAAMSSSFSARLGANLTGYRHCWALPIL